MIFIFEGEKKRFKVTADDYDENRSYDDYYYIVDEMMNHLIEHDLDRYLILLINYLILVVMNTAVNMNTKKNKNKI